MSEKARIATTDRDRLATRTGIVDAKTELTSDVGEIADLFCHMVGGLAFLAAAFI